MNESPIYEVKSIMQIDDRITVILGWVSGEKPQERIVEKQIVFVHYEKVEPDPVPEFNQ